MTQPIFRGGRTIAEIGRAKALVRVGRAQLLAAEQTVLLSAATSYMDVVRDTAILDLRQHNVELLKKQARGDAGAVQCRLADPHRRCPIAGPACRRAVRFHRGAEPA